MLEQILVLVYRTSTGHLRVANDRLFSSRKVAVAFAKYEAKRLGVTIRVLDFAPEVASYEPGGERFDWRANGWYCQHSYEFCSPCHFGYDHPADEYVDYHNA